MRRSHDPPLSFVKRFPDEFDVPLLQVSQPSMQQFGGCGTCCAHELRAFKKVDGATLERQRPSGHYTVDSSADYGNLHLTAPSKNLQSLCGGASANLASIKNSAASRVIRGLPGATINTNDGRAYRARTSGLCAGIGGLDSSVITLFCSGRR